jgi:hypothetical protein
MNDTTLNAPLPAAEAAQPSAGSTQWSDRPSDYAIYKPNSRDSGGVIRFGLNSAKRAIFVDAASQSGERQFDWENKFTMKWGLSDIGSALAVLQGRMPQAKLFHQTDHANSAFELVSRDDPEGAPYVMSISRQEAADKSLRKVSIPITHADAAVLETVLKTAVARIVGW